MERLTVPLAERSYDIIIGDGCLHQTGALCRDAGLRGRVAVITNPTVEPLYGQVVRDSLHAAGYDVLAVQVPDGEQFKNLETLNSIFAALISGTCDRGSFLLALGGGVIGDMTGFAAATYLRGIPFVQVPTTLLSQVDSSVGGKTGVNHELGKNLIGAFHQPRLVVSDVRTLLTLEQRDCISGLAEVIKCAVTFDAEFFTYLLQNVQRIKAMDLQVLATVVQRSCELKAAVVAEDEREAGKRAVLNFGHTLGHAVETLSGYDTYRHGEAVAIGMVQAARISESFGHSTPAVTNTLITLLSSLNLPTELPRYSIDDYVAVLQRDKKVREKGLTFICNKGIGDFAFEKVSEVSSLLSRCGFGG